MKFTCRFVMILCSVLLATPLFAASKIITDYVQLVEALRQGDNVHAIIELDKCKLQSNSLSAASPDLTGGMTRINFDIFSYYQVEAPGGKLRYAVATSISTLTEHRQFGVVQGYARLRIFDDGLAELHLAHFDPKTYEQKSNINYVCALSHGVKLFDATA